MKQYQMQLSHFLKGYLQSAQLRNHQYSMRSFANKLEINSGNLSQILSAKRPVSRQKAVDILNKLDVDEVDLNKILFSDGSNEESFIFDKYFKNFSFSQEVCGDKLDEVLSSDIYFKILALSELKTFSLDAEWIGKKISADIDDVNKALSYLVDSGDINPNKSSQVISQYYKSTDCISNQTIRKYHKAGLSEAMQKIDDLPVDQRDFTSTVFACDKEKYDEAQKLIRSFHKQLVSLMSTGEKNDVYKVSIQLYPCSEQGEETNV